MDAKCYSFVQASTPRGMSIRSRPHAQFDC